MKFRSFIAWLLIIQGSLILFVGVLSLVNAFLRGTADGVTLCVLGGLLLGLGALIQAVNELSRHIAGVAAASSYVARVQKDLSFEAQRKAA
jgi:hypothetical protein